MHDGGLVAEGVGQVHGWICDLKVEERMAVRVDVNGRVFSVSNAGLVFIDPSADGRSRFRVLCEGCPVAGENELKLFVGDDLLFMANITYRENGVASEYYDVIKNSKLFRFPSGLLDRVSPKIPISSDIGRGALEEQLATTKIIIVLFSNRSGSNLVTDILESFGLGAGSTNEPLLADTILEQCAKHDLKSIDHYLAEVIREWKRNDICFLKMSWDALAWLGAEGLLNDLFRNACLIWTRRRDKVAQGISYLRAMRTKTFFVRGDENVVVKNNMGFITDRTVGNLVNEIHNIFVAEMRLEYFITLYSIDPLILYFEDLTADLQGAAKKIREFVSRRLNLDEPKAGQSYVASLVKQSTEENKILREWLLDIMVSGLAAKSPP